MPPACRVVEAVVGSPGCPAVPAPLEPLPFWQFLERENRRLRTEAECGARRAGDAGKKVGRLLDVYA